MVDPLATQKVQPGQVGSASPSSAAARGAKAHQVGSGPSFGDVLQSKTDVGQETIQQAATPNRVQTTQDIDRMMNAAQRSFEEVEQVSNTLNAAISAYQKNQK